MDLEFSPELKQVSAVFFESSNDIDIYTEDNQKDHKFYVKLFERLLSGTGIKLNRTYQLGDKDMVVDCCKKDNSTRKRLYIVDGDYGIQCSTYPDELQSIPHLFVFDFYCVENGLICKKGFLEAINNFTGGIYDDAETLSILDFERTIDYITPHFLELFFYLSASLELGNGVEFGTMESYLKNKSKEVNETMIDKKKQEIISIAQREGNYPNLEELVESRRKRFPIDADTMLRFVSGKDFIIPYITRTIGLNIKMIKGKNPHLGQSKEWWKFNLVQFCKLDKFSKLKTAIIEA